MSRPWYARQLRSRFHGWAVRQAVISHLRLSAAALLVTILLVGGGIYLNARDQAERHAATVATGLGTAIQDVLASVDFADLDEADRLTLAESLSPFLRSGQVHRVKVWETLPNGDVRVVYSDARRYEGDGHVPHPGTARRLAEGPVVGPLDDRRPHSTGQEIDGMYGVLIGFTDAGGSTRILQVYVPTDVYGEVGRALWLQLPLLVGGVVLLAVVLMTLTVRLARRIDGLNTERLAALRYGLAASERERLQLARRLHDGALQDIAGARVALESVARRPQVPPAEAELITTVAEVLGEDGKELRAIVRDHLPPQLLDKGLSRALTDAIGTLPGSEIVRVELPAEIPVSLEAGEAGYHATIEIVRNAIRHSGASQIVVSAPTDTPSSGKPSTGGPSQVVIEISDDGVGFDPARWARSISAC